MLAITGPIGYRKHFLEKTCQENQGHEHNYDHATIVISGKIKILYNYIKDGKLINGESKEFSIGEVIHIKANVKHTIKALEDNTMYMCIFSHRDFDGLVTQTYIGNASAYN